MLILLVLVFGLIVGSFLNVIILRLHQKKDFKKGRSKCPDCKKVLSPYELIPVVSWVVQGGRCRGCRAKLSIQYPLVELATALIFILAYLYFLPVTLGGWAIYLLWLYVLSTLIVLAVYDLKWYLLPDRVMLPLIIPALILLGINFAHFGTIDSLYKPIAAGLLFGGLFYGIAAVSGGKWMGGGDIKLAFIMGLLLGLQKTALAMILAFNTAAVVGLVLIALKLKKRTDYIPFGPFLIAGTIVALLAGTQIIDWYLRTSGFYLLAT
ncbi:MAG TPA: prepilin peptidase [Candidatus Dormibacteraeota bacterium]|nr:prepilin peptidase [Candidatus Dormibacteraeota bacterium]